MWVTSEDGARLFQGAWRSASQDAGEAHLLSASYPLVTGAPQLLTLGLPTLDCSHPKGIQHFVFSKFSGMKWGQDLVQSLCKLLYSGHYSYI